MADTLYYQNPTSHDFQLDNIVVTAGSPDLIREALVIGDGGGATTVYATVKAGSTAAAAGDAALVVAISPNNTIPVSPTTSANTNTNPFFTSITDGTTKATVISATAALKTDLSSVAGVATLTATSGMQLVGIADGFGNPITSNGTTYSGRHALDVNLLGSDGTAFGTAGVIDNNIKNIGGSAVSTAASGIQKVGIVGATGTALDATLAGVLDANIRMIGNNSISTVSSGVQKVGIADNSGVAFHSTGNALNTALIGGVTSVSNFTYTSATGSSNFFIGSTSQYPAWVVELEMSGTITGGVITWQVSNDTVINYTTLSSAYILDPNNNYAQISNPWTVPASGTQTFVFLVGAYSSFRLNFTTPLSGAGATINAYYGPLPISPITTVSQSTASNLNATVVPSGSAIFEVSPTTAANTNANPFFTSITDGTTKATVISATSALKTDVSSVAGTATNTAASGTLLVGIADGAGNKITTNSSTYSSKFALDVNLLGSDGTAFGTAGVLDNNIKNIGGSTVVTAATGTQLVGVADGSGNKITSNSTTQSRSLDANIVSVLGATLSKTNALFTIPGDNTNSITMKAASTAAANADTSLVVQLNPEQPNLNTALNVSLGSTIVEVAPTTGANTKTNPFFNAITDGTNVITAAISALGTAPTGTEVEAVNSVLLPFNVAGTGLSTAFSQALTTSAQHGGAAAHSLYGYQIFNPNTATVYVFWYNTTSSPTIGSTTNLAMQIGIPAGAAANLSLALPVYFSSGIFLAVSTTATTSAAPGTGLVITTLYK